MVFVDFELEVLLGVCNFLDLVLIIDKVAAFYKFDGSL